MKRFLFSLLALALLTAPLSATVTVKKMTKLRATPGSNIDIYYATFSTSATLATLDSVVFVDPTGRPFAIDAVDSLLATMYIYLKAGADSVHIKVNIDYALEPTARPGTYSGREWTTVGTRSDSDAVSFIHTFKSGTTVPMTVATVGGFYRFAILEYLTLNEYITSTTPATVYLAIKRRYPNAR